MHELKIKLDECDKDIEKYIMLEMTYKSEYIDLKLKKYGEALDAFQKIVVHYPQIPGTYLYLTRCYHIPHYEQHARESLTKLSELKASHKIYMPLVLLYSHAHASWCLASHCPDHRQAALQMAFSSLETLLQTSPKDFHALILRGECWLLEGNVKKASQLARELFEQNRDKERIYEFLSHCLSIKGEYEDALYVAMSGLEKNPGNALLRFSLAEMEKKLKHEKEALRNYMRAYWLLKDTPLYDKIWKKRLPEVEELSRNYYASWLKEKPGGLLWQKYYSQHNFPDWGYDPAFFSSVLAEANKLHGGGKISEAIALLHQLLESYPPGTLAVYAQIYRLLGILYHAQENFPKSLECYEKSLQISPHDVEVYKSLFGYYETRKSSSKRDALLALACIDMVLLLERDNTEISKWQKKFQEIESFHIPLKGKR
jgi:tetratricopeptide (TPR) repeat protein